VTFLKKAKVPDDQWIFAREIDGKWVETDGKSSKVDKVMIRTKYVREHLADQAEQLAPRCYPPVPDQVFLDDAERFHDQDGNALEIAAFGERTAAGIYFCAKEVGAAFGIKGLVNTVIHKDSTFQEGEDYCRFSTAGDEIPVGMQQNQVYLTYTGILRVLYTSRVKSVRAFVSWASETLFAAQMGTPVQRQRLAAKTVGIKYETIKDICKATSGETPCIYLICLGAVKNLRRSMELGDQYADADCVYKYGYTGKLDVRFSQHQNTFKNVKNVDLQLVYHAYIDVRYCSEAEGMIRDVMNDNCAHIKYQKQKELVCIPKNKVARVMKEYDAASTLYWGCLQQQVADNESIRKDMKLLTEKCRADLLHKDVALANKDVELADQRATIIGLQKDLEIAMLKLELATK